MKAARFVSLCGFAIGILQMQPCIAADFEYHTDFSVPPYELDKSIVGQNGWENFGSGYHAPEDASKIVRFPWNQEEFALCLQAPSRHDGRVRVRDTSVTGSDLSGSFSVTTSMAFDFEPKAHSGKVSVVTFADTYKKHSPVMFGMKYSAGGGLFYRSSHETEEIIILPKDEIKMYTFYTFHLEADPSAGTFDLRVTGSRGDDSPFSYSVSGVQMGIEKCEGFFIEAPDDDKFITYIGKGRPAETVKD